MSLNNMALMKQLMAQYFLLLSGKRAMKGDFTIGLHKIIFDDEVRLRKDPTQSYLLRVEDSDGWLSDIAVWDLYAYQGIRDIDSGGFYIKSKGPLSIFQGSSLSEVVEILNGIFNIPLAGHIFVQDGKYIMTPHISADSIAEKTTGHGVTINSCGSIYMNYQEGHFWDSGDYVHYDRPNNRYLFRIANQIVGYVDATGFHDGAPP